MSQSNMVYRIEDIDRAKREGVNSEFGHKRRPYDLFRWKYQSPICRARGVGGRKRKLHRMRCPHVENTQNKKYKKWLQHIYF